MSSRAPALRRPTVSSPHASGPAASPAPSTLRRSAAPGPTPVSPVPRLRLSAMPSAPQAVSSPNDPAEREASAIAAKIVQMPVPNATPGPSAGGPGGGVYRQIAAAGSAPSSRDDTIHRRAETAGVPHVAAGIQSSLGPGAPLPAQVRGFMEPRFGADFGAVRMHTGGRAAALNEQLNADAFTVGNHVAFGEGKFRPETRDGKALIAHELTHTIQQRGTIQRSPAVPVAHHEPPKVQRLGIGDALDYFADKANLIPGFRMLTVVLGVNPINMSSVARSAANILRALVELIPGGGLITQALDNYGVFEKVGAWVEEQIASLALTGSALKAAVTTFLGSLSWSDIFNLGSVWERAKRIFTEPIDRLIEFGKGLVTGILRFVKEAILRPLGKLAEGTAGWDLLKAVLGEDPITGDPVERNADTLIGGFMKLIGQEEVWNNLKKANAVARAWAWFQGALDGLLGFVRQIPSLFVTTLQSLRLEDIVIITNAFAKIGSVFGSFFGRFLSWAGDQVLTLLQIIFEVLAPDAIPYIKKAAGAFKQIVSNPIGFIGNLVKAGIQGFKQFGANFLAHLKKSLIEWLTGTLSGAAIYIPQAFTLREIVKFVLSVLGLTWQNIRQKLVKATSELAVKALETGFDIVVTLVREGPAAAWEKIKEQLSNLREMVIDEVMSFVKTRVVEAAITKLLTSLNPAGAFIQAVLAIYNTIMFFIERLKQIARVAMAVIDSLAAIANGVIGAAADKVEQTMAGLLTLVISFLARIAGLGKVSDAVLNIVNKIRAPIDRALDKVVAWIVATAKKLGKLVQSAAQRVLEWWRARKRFTADGEAHELFFTGGKDNPVLTVASTALPIEAFLESKERDASTTQRAAIKAIRTQLKEAKDLMKQAKSKEGDEALQKKIEGVMNAMAPQLIILLAGSNWGTPEHPAPLDYEKRRANAYPVFYLATGALKRLTQDTLKTRYADPEYKNRSVWRFAPLEKPPGAPAELGKLGLGAGSQADVGTKFEFDEKGKRGGGVGEFKSLIGKYGLTASDYGWDIDHVIELQIGGKDVWQNLWPLPAGENRSSGSKIKAAKTMPPGEDAMTVTDAHKKKKGTGKTLWLIITTTHQR